MAARCFGAVSRLMPATVMAFVVESILPLLGASDSDRKRQGASEALASILYWKKPVKVVDVDSCYEDLELG